MNKKILISLLVLTLLVSLWSIIVKASNLNKGGNDLYQSSYTISPDSNFFGQEENQEKVTLPENYLTELMIKGFKFVAETEELELYVKESYFNIAVYDKASGYLWYSVNPNYLQYMLSGTSRFFVESGVVIEYYNMDNISIDNNRSYVSGPKYNVEKSYEYNDQGLTASFVFADLGISFDVEVSIAGDKLSVRLPIDSLKEEDVEKTMLNLDGTTYQKITQYRLKSVFIFPYFGSNNYEINGYSFIPDGSGALIRYNEENSSTAYIKRVYGADEGVSRYRQEISQYYIREELTATMPIFGVNHGFEQAAFLAVISKGDGYSEIHSYPYGYNSYPFNTTFAKFIVRERYIIQTSGNSADSFQLINESPYNTDFQVDYYFLRGVEASYSGMAKKYREVLGLEGTSNGVSTNLTLIGIDFKNGLFGKDYVKMTTYQDAMEITQDLLDAGLTNLNLIYQGYGKGGYYDNTPVKPQVSGLLGGKDDFADMNEYLLNQGIDVYYLNNPLLSYDQGLGKQIIRKTTLSVFQTNEGRTSLFNSAFYLNPANVSESILKYDSSYQKMKIEALALETVGNALFTYRYSSTDYNRNQMIEILREEMALLSDYKLALYQPNAYLFEYLDTYMFAPIESNKYAYVTDSIPFIQLVLAGSKNLNSPYVNYVSDYDLLSLRLIEYGISPSFLITKEPTHMLRFTNSEYIYTSEYELWEETIKSVSSMVEEALMEVSGEKMVNHRYVMSGLAEVTYENGTKIYVNYNNQDVTYDSLVIEANAYKVVKS